MEKPSQVGPFTELETTHAFNTFDLDNNNFIGAAELRHIFSSIGQLVTDAEVDEMIKMCDTDGDGQVSYGEFSRMVYKYCGPPLVDAIAAKKEKLNDSTLSKPMYEDNTKSPLISSLPATMTTPVVYAKSPQFSSVPATMTTPNPTTFTAPVVYAPLNASSIANKTPQNNILANLPPASNPATQRLPPITVVAKIEDPAKRRSELKELCEKLHLRVDKMPDILSRFEECDKDKSGTADIVEFKNMFPGQKETEVESLFNLFDIQKDGNIDFREFSMGILSMLTTNKDDKVKYAFQIFDKDNDGYLTKVELMKVLRSSYMASNDAQVEKKAAAILRQADTNNDNQVSYEEFLNIHRKYPNLLFPASNVSLIPVK